MNGREEFVSRIVFGGYVTAIVIVAQLQGVDGIIVTGGLTILAALAGVKGLNKILKRWS